MLSTPFHINLHVRVAETGARQRASEFGRSFEKVSEALARLPRMFIEPDGAFVWVGGGEPSWQLDGVLYDGAAGLWYVELKGWCPEARFDELLGTLGWPETAVTVQLVREAISLGEGEFRRHAGWAR